MKKCLELEKSGVIVTPAAATAGNNCVGVKFQRRFMDRFFRIYKQKIGQIQTNFGKEMLGNNSLDLLQPFLIVQDFLFFFALFNFAGSFSFIGFRGFNLPFFRLVACRLLLLLCFVYLLSGRFFWHCSLYWDYNPFSVPKGSENFLRGERMASQGTKQRLELQPGLKTEHVSKRRKLLQNGKEKC